MATIAACIKDPVEHMSPEEVGILYLILRHGKGASAILEQTTPGGLRFWNTSYRQIATMMNSAFKSGLGVVDALKDRDNNYGRQLEYVIHEVLIKALEVPKPFFTHSPDSFQGALDREQWITEKLLDAWWQKLPEELKRELAGQIEELLREAGVDPAKAGRAAAALIAGGLTVVRVILGFQFHILLAVLANLIVRGVIGRGLSVAANALLQRLAGILFGPIGWIISFLLLAPLLAEWFNPREYDKYIPAVFFIGIKRLALGADTDTR